LNANVNQPRKRLDLTLKGFARFAQNKPASVKLIMHCKWDELGCDIEDLGRRLGISDRLIAVGDVHRTPGLNDETLNLLYNACEVGLNTSMGEGWGLISFEHAATGAAQVLTAHECASELWAGAADLLEPVETLSEKGFLLEMRVVSFEQVAAALNQLYEDREHLEAVSLACHERASRPEYQWSVVAGRWHELFESILY
jgi:D-inositol-3-phosphate glycosyltransferase